MAGTSGAKTALRAFCPAMTIFFWIDRDCSTFAWRTATDIRGRQRYINPARHRPGFWRSDGNHK
jgi:hypothetical protein